jgi:hypothetical protein
MSVKAHNFIGQNNSSTPAEVISNLFPDDMQQKTADLPYENQYNSSMGQNLIKIQANLHSWKMGNSNIDTDILTKLQYPVYGIMTGDFTYGVQSEWEQMQFPQILDLTDIANLGAYAGTGELGAVARTTKFWKRSGDIKLSPTFRLLDVDGNGAVLQYAHALLLMSTAVGTAELLPGGAGMVTTAQNVIDFAVQGLTDIASKFDPSGGLVSNIGGLANSAINDVLLENINDYNTLRASPPPVDIQIGKIFRHNDMVITDVSFVFSKEYTAKGPVYADVTLQIASRKIISTINDVGLSTKMMGAINDPSTDNPTPYGNITFEYGSTRQDDAYIEQLAQNQAQASSQKPAGPKAEAMTRAQREAENRRQQTLNKGQ